MATSAALTHGPAWRRASEAFRGDIVAAAEHLAEIETSWEGKACVLKLKEADFGWRQMEWWGFYFEYLCRDLHKADFQFPGDRYDNTTFDMKRRFNWDLKAKAIKTDSLDAILNDQAAMRSSTQDYGEHGVILALCDVEYNDEDRSFQKWHDRIKGEPSRYVQRRREEGARSRYRKSRADLAQILFYRFDDNALEELNTFRQGRNSNDAVRPVKFMLNLEKHQDHVAASLGFSADP